MSESRGELEAQLAKVKKDYDNYIKNGLFDKARAKLPLLNRLEGEVKDAQED